MVGGTWLVVGGGVSTTLAGCSSGQGMMLDGRSLESRWIRTDRQTDRQEEQDTAE